MRCSSRTSTPSPASVAIACGPLREHARRQLVAGQRWPASRASLLHVAEHASALERLAHRRRRRSETRTCAASIQDEGCPPVRYDPPSKLARHSPSAIACAACSAATAVPARWTTATRVSRRWRAVQPADDRNAPQVVGREVLAAAGADEQRTRRLPVGRRGRRGEHVEQLAGQLAPRAGARRLPRRTRHPAWLSQLKSSSVKTGMTRRSVCRSAEGCEVERDRRRPVGCVHRVELSVRRGDLAPGIACPAVCSGLESDEPAPPLRRKT